MDLQYLLYILKYYKKAEKDILSSEDTRQINKFDKVSDILFEAMHEFSEKDFSILLDRIIKGRSVIYASAKYNVTESYVYRLIDKFYLNFFIKIKKRSFKKRDKIS